MKEQSMPSILVIKHGALGDIVQASGAFEALRAYHAHDRLVLLTTPAFETLAHDMGYFDRIILDERAPLWHLKSWIPVVRTLRATPWQRVYDLQWSTRVGLYYHLLRWRRPEMIWSGVAPGCDLPHPNTLWRVQNAFDRLKQQLIAAGMPTIPLPHIRWAQNEQGMTTPHRPYVVLIIGASRPEKRWGTKAFSALAQHLHHAGYHVVLIGSAAEKSLGSAIRDHAPFVDDRTGQTSWLDLAQLLKSATAVVGNDTGPTHMAAAAGVPVVVLFFRHTSPYLSAPLGPYVSVLHCQMGAHDLKVEAVWEALDSKITEYTKVQQESLLS